METLHPFPDLKTLLPPWMLSLCTTQGQGDHTELYEGRGMVALPLGPLVSLKSILVRMPK